MSKRQKEVPTTDVETAVANIEAEAAVEPEAAAPADAEWMTFAETAKLLGVRFQQVYQRAVVRGKMTWKEEGKRKIVRREDVVAWQKIRAELSK